MNAEFVHRSHEVWDSMEKDRWIYNLENDDGFVPNFRKSAIKWERNMKNVKVKKDKKISEKSDLEQFQDNFIREVDEDLKNEPM